MATDLPYAAEAELSLSPEELKALEDQYNQEQQEGHITVQTKFNYAWGLIRSAGRGDEVQGVRLLQELFRSEPNRRRECLYYLALGNYKMNNFEEAKRFNGLLLDKEPNNMQALSLARLIEAKITRENHIALGVTAGALALGALIVGAMFRRSSR